MLMKLRGNAMADQFPIESFQLHLTTELSNQFSPSAEWKFCLFSEMTTFGACVRSAIQSELIKAGSSPSDPSLCTLVSHRRSNFIGSKIRAKYIKLIFPFLDLHNKFQKPLPQSGGVKFGEKFVLDCRPPAGNPKPLGKLLKKRTRVKFEISGAPDPHARKCSSVELTCQLIVNLGPLLVYRQSAARVLPATST